MKRLFWSVFVVLLLIGCRPAKTAEEECRRQNTINHIGDGFNRERSTPAADSVARTLENSRCDEIGIRERAEKHQAELEKRQERVLNEARERDRQSKSSLIRMAPKTIILGATLNEMRVICQNQTGNIRVFTDKVSCYVGEYSIIDAVFKDEQAVLVDTYYEGSDVSETVSSASKVFGPYQQTGITDDGNRVFKWKIENLIVNVAGYSRGAMTRFIRIVEDNEDNTDNTTF